MAEEDNILEHLPFYIAIKDHNFKYTYCNEKLAEDLQLDSPKQIIGKTDYDLYNEWTGYIFQAGDQCVLNGGTFLNRPEIQPFPDKTLKILTSKSLLPNSIGINNKIVITFTDITELSQDDTYSIVKYHKEDQRYYFKIGDEDFWFTQLEYEILKYILQGLTAKQIALRKELSPATVRDYTDRLKIKLQCSYKNGLVEAAMSLGLNRIF